MSVQVDSRIVEMRFDNKQFENGAASTIETLAKLKQGLEFKNIDTSSITKMVTDINNKLSPLKGLVNRELTKMVDQASAGIKRLVAELTTIPIKSGFQEYETQMNAVQTILANTQKEGTTIKDVNRALDELNLYADKTIYNFTEMTRNIGTFTAAGVKLKTSVNAIQGIANLAAVSGSTSQQASVAMYQLSQALASGTVKLQDWNSVVNAGMGGQVFQEALKETSRLLGTGVDEAIEAEGSFRESLKQGWLTTEVLTQTLKKFTTSGAIEYVASLTNMSKEAVSAEVELAKSTYDEAEAFERAAASLAEKSGASKDDILSTLKFAQTAEDAATKVKTFSQLIDTLKEALQSGWSQSFRIIVGDFEEAKELFTEISDAFGAAIGAWGDARNKLLDEVFTKKTYTKEIAKFLNVSEDAVSKYQDYAKKFGISSQEFKDSLNAFSGGDENINRYVSNLLAMSNGSKSYVEALKQITGISGYHIIQLKEYGDAFGYTSEEFEEYLSLVPGVTDFSADLIRSMLQAKQLIERPSGRQLLIDGLRNSLIGLLSVIKPIRQAFQEAFPQASAENIYKMLERFREFTKTLRLSEKNSEDLRKTFKGLFDVLKLVMDALWFIVKLIIPVEKPIRTLADIVLTITGTIGDLLSKLVAWIRSSERVQIALYYIQEAAHFLWSTLSDLIRATYDFIVGVMQSEGAAKLFNSIVNAFIRLGEKAAPYIEKTGNKLAKLWEYIRAYFNFSNGYLIERVSDAFAYLAEVIDDFSLETIKDGIEFLKEKVKALYDLAMANEGIAAFVRHVQEYKKMLEEAFTWDNLVNGLENTVETIKKLFSALFGWFDVGSFMAGAGGFSIIYALVSAVKQFGSVIDLFSGIPDLIGHLGDTLVAYQRNLQANTILKIAGAIAILAVAITLLSFADMTRAWQAALMLTLIGTALLVAIGYFTKMTQKTNQVTDALTTFAQGVNNMLTNLSGAVKMRQLSKVILNIGITIGIIVAAIAGLAYMYSQDRESLIKAVALMGLIGGFLVASLVLLASMDKILGNTKGSAFTGTARAMLGMGILLFASASVIKTLFTIKIPGDWVKRLGILGGLFAGLAALAIIMGVAGLIAGGGSSSELSVNPVFSQIAGRNAKSNGGALTAGPIIGMAILLWSATNAIQKIFTMNVPGDWLKRMGILGGVFAGMAALALILGIAGRIAGGGGSSSEIQNPITNQIFKGMKINSGGSVGLGPILGLAVLLVAATNAIQKIFTMDIPDDYGLRLAILGGLFVAVAALVLVIGYASKMAGGAIKAGGTLLALSAFIVVLVGGLFVLSIMPIDKMLYGAGALSAVLLALAVGLWAASKISNENTWKTVLAMAIMVGVLVAALSLLALVPLDKLIKSTLSLGIVLALLAWNFREISKIKGDNKSITMMGMMIGALITMVASLYILSMQPWKSLLAAAASLSLTLFALAKTFKMVNESKLNGTVLPKIKLLGLLMAASFIIMIELATLAAFPWQGLLAGAVGLGIALVALAYSFKMINQSKLGPNLVSKIETMAIMLVASLFIVAELKELAMLPWKGLIAGATAMGIALMSIAGAMAIMGLVKVEGMDMAGIIVAAGAMYIVAEAIARIAVFDVGALEAACLSLGSMMLVMATTLGIITLVGTASVAAYSGMMAFGAFIVGFTALLILMGALLNNSVIKGLISGGAEVFKMLGQAIGDFIGAIINGIMTGVASALPAVGTSLSQFMINLIPFIVLSKMLDEEALKSVGLLAGLIIALTVGEIVNGIASLLGMSLTELGDELSDFMISLIPFLLMLPFIDQESLKACTLIAGMILKITAAQLISGLTQFLGLGTGTLSSFAEELVAFGPSIVEFANTVKDVKAESVRGAAAAGTIMATLANKIPNSGGILARIVGDNKIDDFGEQLVDFGYYITKFAKKVKDIPGDAVDGAASCTGIMIELAKEIPNSGGVLSWIVGDNKFDDFGDELADFGEDMEDFAKYVKDIPANAVDGAARCTEIMIALAKEIPNSGGIVSWFSGDNKLDEFGEQVADFGEYMADFADEVKDIDANNMTATVEAFETLMELADYGEEVNVKYLGKFIDGLKKVSLDGVAGFIEGFKDGAKDVSTAINTFFNSARTNIKNKGNLKESGKKSGKDFILGLKEGIEKNKSLAITAVETLASEMVEAYNNEVEIESPSKVMKESGKYFVEGIEEGVAAEAPLAYRMVQNVSKEMVNSFYTGLLEAKKASNSKYMDMDLLDFQKDILQQTGDVLKEYADKLQSSTDSMMSAFDLFSEIQKKDVVGKDQLKKNLEDQLDEYTEYIDVMNKLNLKLDGTSLLSYLQTLGADSVDQLKVFNSMTAEELTNYSQMYDAKMALAKEAAGRQLTGLQEETESKLEDIFGVMSGTVSLFDFASVFDGSLESITAYVNNINADVETALLHASNMSGQFPEMLAFGVENNMGIFSDRVEAAIENSLVNIDKLEIAKKAQEATKEVGVNLGKGVMEGMSSPEVMDDAMGFVKEVIDGAKAKYLEYAEIQSPSELMKREVGVYLGQGIIVGMTDGVQDETYLQGLYAAFDAVIQNFMLHFKETYIEDEPLFNTLGEDINKGMIAGLTDTMQDVIDSGTSLGDSTYGGVSTNFNYDELFKLGEAAGNGLAAGIRSKINEIAQAAIQAAQQAVAAARAALNVNSPSKVMMEVGGFFSEGFAKGITNTAKMVAIAAQNLALESIETTKDAIYSINTMLSDNDYDMSPIIRPVMDLSDVQNGFKKIGQLANDTYDISGLYRNAASTASAFASNNQSSTSGTAQNNTTKGDTTYEFNQYNYSPKALTQSEIYRQTRNQFAAFRRAVNTQ